MTNPFRGYGNRSPVWQERIGQVSLTQCRNSYRYRLAAFGVAVGGAVASIAVQSVVSRGAGITVSVVSSVIFIGLSLRSMILITESVRRVRIFQHVDASQRKLLQTRTLNNTRMFDEWLARAREASAGPSGPQS